MSRVKIHFKEDSLELWDMGDYMDNASSAGVGASHMNTIYRKLRQDGKIKIVKEDQTTLINRTEDLFFWLKQNGYDYYVSKLFIAIFKDRERQIRYE